MMLPNFISVSVMPGCWADADDHEANDRNPTRKADGASLRDLIICDPPRRTADFVLFLVGGRLAPGPGNRLAFSCWVSRSTQVAPVKSGHRGFQGDNHAGADP